MSSPKANKRILFVGMTESIHVARWINQLEGTNWERFLFPVYTPKPHTEFKDLTLINGGELPGFPSNHSIRYMHGFLPYFGMNVLNRMIRKRLKPPRPVTWPPPFIVRALVASIQHLKPDIVHSLEFQGAGYLALEAKKILKEKFPKWIATNWGSDIYLFGRLPEHHDRVRAVLENCDYYSCECERDIQIGRDMGFKGTILPVLPSRGGFQTEQMTSFRQPGPVSKRKIIMLKGYQGWAGRALVAFRALRRCVDVLQGYTIVLYAVVDDVKIAASLFEQETGIPVKIIYPFSPEEEILRGFGSARIYIGLSISDGISTSLLEAIVMGAFPVQSCTACADEWIQDGKSGLIVPPEEPEEIAIAIRRALTDDQLVDQAAEINAKTVKERLDYSVIQPQVVKNYQDIYESRISDR